MAAPLAAPALGLPLWTMAATVLGSGPAIEVFAVGWMPALSQEIPEEMMSRVSAYDWPGSIGPMPIGPAPEEPAAAAPGHRGVRPRWWWY